MVAEEGEEELEKKIFKENPKRSWKHKIIIFNYFMIHKNVTV